MKLHRVLAVLVGFVVTASLASVENIADGHSVVTAMHARYEKSWYDTTTFTQKSTTYNEDGTTKVETWYEAASLPGRLRIDFGPPSDGNGAILADGKGIFFTNGKQTGTRPLLNLLLVLGFDVYKQSPDTTIAQLKSEGIDVTKFHEDTWKGEPVYVVGAEQGDLKSTQFWVEKNRLLFMRLIQPNRQVEKSKDDIRFTDYRQMPKGYIAARVEVYNGEKMVFSEEYSDIRTDVKLKPDIFDPAQFSTAHWEK